METAARPVVARTRFREVEAVKSLWFAEVGSLDQVDVAYFRGLASQSIDQWLVF
jgi:hypothetical protein